MRLLQGYIAPILNACLLFPLAAALITLPFMIHQYRRYGGIPVLSAVVVYGFVLYMMCAYLLTVLPLPARHEVLAMPAKAVQYIPFSTYADAFRNAGFSLRMPSTFLELSCWRRLLRGGGLFEILANIVMQIPLGVFLRYYFRRSWKQTLVIGFLVSLFYELTQLSGLYFIYPKAWRLCSVDDLIDNTLGAMLGYGIAPVLCAILPSRDELDRISLRKERRVTLTRRVTAILIDWLLASAAFFLLILVLPVDGNQLITLLFAGYFLWILLVFIIGQRLFHGQTVGKALLRIRLVDVKTGATPSVFQLLIRYSILYLLFPFLFLIFWMVMLIIIMMIFVNDRIYKLIGIIGAFAFLGGTAFTLWHMLSVHHEMPYSYRSHTRVIVLPRKHGPDALGRNGKQIS